MDSKELQSRREFFKSTAKKVLPIVGAIAISQIPLPSQAHEGNVQKDCSSGCSGGCYTGCYYSCQGTCEGGCQNSCDGSCTGDCSGSCSYGSRVGS